MKVVEETESNLELDDLTAADGNCMITAIIQQLKRVDIYPHLSAQIKKIIEGTITLDMVSQVRCTVQQFVMENIADPAIQTISGGLEGTWEDYWIKMSQNGVWGDEIFLHCIARLLKVDIFVISRSSTEAMPYIVVSGSNVNPGGDSSDSTFKFAVSKIDHKGKNGENVWVCKKISPSELNWSWRFLSFFQILLEFFLDFA